MVTDIAPPMIARAEGVEVDGHIRAAGGLSASLADLSPTIAFALVAATAQLLLRREDVA
jgi:hypothetical protein